MGYTNNGIAREYAAEDDPRLSSARSGSRPATPYGAIAQWSDNSALDETALCSPLTRPDDYRELHAANGARMYMVPAGHHSGVLHPGHMHSPTMHPGYMHASHPRMPLHPSMEPAPAVVALEQQLEASQRTQAALESTVKCLQESMQVQSSMLSTVHARNHESQAQSEAAAASAADAALPARLLRVGRFLLRTLDSLSGEAEVAVSRVCHRLLLGDFAGSGHAADPGKVQLLTLRQGIQASVFVAALESAWQASALTGRILPGPLRAVLQAFFMPARTVTRYARWGLWAALVYLSLRSAQCCCVEWADQHGDDWWGEARARFSGAMQSAAAALVAPRPRGSGAIGRVVQNHGEGWGAGGAEVQEPRRLKAAATCSSPEPQHGGPGACAVVYDTEDTQGAPGGRMHIEASRRGTGVMDQNGWVCEMWKVLGSVGPHRS